MGMMEKPMGRDGRKANPLVMPEEVEV